MRRNGGGRGGRRPQKHDPRDAGSAQPSDGVGSGPAKDLKVPHPETPWTCNDWRQWDKDNGRVLWMGSIQEAWKKNMISGFFLEHGGFATATSDVSYLAGSPGLLSFPIFKGATNSRSKLSRNPRQPKGTITRVAEAAPSNAPGTEVSIARKGRDNYCFVTFKSAEVAKDFMARHNHQLLPGIQARGIRFNMRPRTRPRWHREEGNRTIGGPRDPPHEPKDAYKGRRPEGQGVTIRGTRDSHGGIGGQHVGHWRSRGRGSGLEGRPRAAFTPEKEEHDGRKDVLRRGFKRSCSRSRSRSSSSSSSSSSSHDSHSNGRHSNPDRRQYHSWFHQMQATSDRDNNGCSLRSHEHRYCRKGGRGASRGILGGGRTGVNKRMYNNDNRNLTTKADGRDYFNDVSTGVCGIARITNGGVHRSCSEPREVTGVDGGDTNAERRDRRHPAVAIGSAPCGDPDGRQASGDNITPDDDNCGNGNRHVDIEIGKKRTNETSLSHEREKFISCGKATSYAFSASEQCVDPVEQAKLSDVAGIEGSERYNGKLSSASASPGEDNRHRQTLRLRSRTATSNNSQGQQQSQAPDQTLASTCALDQDRGTAEDIARRTQDTTGRNGFLRAETFMISAEHERTLNHPRRISGIAAEDGSNTSMAEFPVVSRTMCHDQDVPGERGGFAGGLRVAQRLGSGGVGSTLDVEDVTHHTSNEADGCMDNANLSPAGTRGLENSPSGGDVDKDDRRQITTGLISVQKGRMDANSQAEDARHGLSPPSPSPQTALYPTCQTEQVPLPSQTADLVFCAPSSGSSPVLQGGLETLVPKLRQNLEGGMERVQQPRCEREKSTLGAQGEINGLSGRSEISRAQNSDGFSSGPDVGSNQFLQVLTTSTEKPMKESGAQAATVKPPAPRGGRKRGSTTDITLAQVIDHHMARRRLNEVGGGSILFTERGSICRNTGEVTDAQHNRRINTSTSVMAAVVARPLSDGSTVVAAAWANGDVLPLTTAAAPHMRLIAPTLAGEPEGRQVVIRTAAAVAAGATALALPDHSLEVTGVRRDGLLLELYPNVESMQYEGDGEGSVSGGLFSGLARRIQSAFHRLVELDLELDTVRLPRVEAVDIVPSGSSSGELLEWLNESTAPMLRLEGIPRGIGNVGQAEYMDDFTGPFNVREGGLSVNKPHFIGIDSGIGPFLPRTGLLRSFKVDIYPIVLPQPTPPPIQGARRRRSTVVHLALTMSDSSVFRGGGGGAVLSSGSGDAESHVMNARGGSDSVTPEETAVRSRKLNAQLACVPPTSTTSGLTWREVGGLMCVAAVSKLAIGPKTELDRNIRLAEGLHTAQIGALASRVAASRVLLVIMAERQGASAEVVASRLSDELMVKGKNPTVLDMKTYLRQGKSPTYNASTRRNHSTSAAVSSSQVDSSVLNRTLAALMIQARAETDSLRVDAGRAAGVGVAPACQGCDLVIVHGSEALDTDILSPEGFGLSPTEVLSVFVDTVPQVCVDSLTPVSGSDVRMLRVLLAARGGIAANATTKYATYVDTAAFLHEWLVAEKTEEFLWQRFHATADVIMNTALPYDLQVLKPLAEPLLRSVAPPIGLKKDGGGGRSGGDGCRSSTYALARSTLRLLGLCDAFHAPPIPASSVLSGLF